MIISIVENSYFLHLHYALYEKEYTAVIVDLNIYVYILVIYTKKCSSKILVTSSRLTCQWKRR